MTTTVTMRYEGAPSCVDCQRTGVPVCAHVGFNVEAWDWMVGRHVYVPGLDPNCDGPGAVYTHTLTAYHISEDRKTIALTVHTARPPLHDLARHLSIYGDVRAKAAVRAVHHETGDVLEEGFYDRFLVPGMAVAVDRDAYHVAAIEYPNRDPKTGVAPDVDLQVARLVPVPTDTVRPLEPAKEAP